MKAPVGYSLDSVAPAKDYPKTNKTDGVRATFLNGVGDGIQSSQSYPLLGANTVNGNVRDGATFAKNSSMRLGAGGGAKKGLRATFLGGANDSATGSGTGYQSVLVNKTYAK